MRSEIVAFWQAVRLSLPECQKETMSQDVPNSTPYLRCSFLNQTALMCVNPAKSISCAAGWARTKKYPSLKTDILFKLLQSLVFTVSSFSVS